MGLFSKMAKSAVVLAAFAVVNSAAVKVNNPIMYVDSPDPSIVRVDDA
jgi:beta-xylosidase